MPNPQQPVDNTGQGLENSIAVRNGVVPIRDVYIPNGVYGYRFELPADGEWHSLNEPGLGYFSAAMPALPAGSVYDRSLRALTIKNLSTLLSVQLGGVMNADASLGGYPNDGDDLGPRERVALMTGALSNVAVRNDGAAPVTVSVLLITDDL